MRKSYNLRLTPYREVLKGLIDKEASSLKETIQLLDRMKELLYQCEPECRRIAEKRGVNIRQSGVSVVGSLFSWGVHYLLIKIQELGGLPLELNFSISKDHELVRKYATIEVGDERLKPDMDLLIFSEREDTPLLIFSLKTSLRERAGQTHRWKLVLDIALHCKELKEKYALDYKVERDVKLGFITTNFYGELKDPQHRATLRFFDYVYLARDDVRVGPPVKRLSEIVEDLKEIYGA